MKIMIIDDTRIMRLVLIQMLTVDLNFNKEDVTDFESCKDALRRLDKIRPDYIFLDIAMPDFNGIDAIVQMKEISPESKIIMCTSSKSRRDVVLCAKRGADGYIVKPPTLERLKKTLGIRDEIETEKVKKIFGIEDEKLDEAFDEASKEVSRENKEATKDDKDPQSEGAIKDQNSEEIQ